MADAETTRLDEDARRVRNWTRWGPYLSERQWGTVREDYSANGECWTHFPHDHARSRAYRWGEDGLLGICDRECRLCFAIALWNGQDPILKERLFGLTGPEGNHGEDVKENYYYLDAVPTSAYLRARYKYPHGTYPYERLVAEAQQRSRMEREFELGDTGIFDESRYFDVDVEYAKASPDDILIRVTVANRGHDRASIHLLPTLWFRNTWSEGRAREDRITRPHLARIAPGVVEAVHPTLGTLRLTADGAPPLLFTENETNRTRLYGLPNRTPYVKDAFHECLVAGRSEAINPALRGTKAAAWYQLDIPGGGCAEIRLRLAPPPVSASDAFDDGFAATFAARHEEADAFYRRRIPAQASDEEARVIRQGYAGLLWTKQFYSYVVKEWLPGSSDANRRNGDWSHVHSRDILSVPDAWEYPWFAAWDLAFHAIPLGAIDPHFAKHQLLLLLREWYMHSNGQMPAYEFAFGDVNPPVHAWACWRIYKMTGVAGQRDQICLRRAFQKLLLNFTWWVNRKDLSGKHIFAGGFLGLDNIGVFDRSHALPTGGYLEQADGTAWMAFYCSTMLSIALELSRDDPSYEDIATTFFEHFVAIIDAMNSLGGTGLWDEQDGFYYDQLHVNGRHHPLRIRSMVGVIPLFACEILADADVAAHPGFAKRLNWFIANRPELARLIVHAEPSGPGETGRRLLALPSRERLIRVLRYVLDEAELLSPYGVRSLSRVHAAHPFEFEASGTIYRVGYEPAESTSVMFGGNSNWRGPIWFPLNYLLIEALERYHHFYGDSLQVECPVGSGRLMSLGAVAGMLQQRLAALFLPNGAGGRPLHGGDRRYADDPHWRDLVLFYEYFDGDTGRGVGASHQTGWTALVVRCLEDIARARR